MNIFYLDADPKTAASYHCDKHVVKMILEYAQLLSTAHRMLDGELTIEKRFGPDGQLKKRKRYVHPNADKDAVLYGVTHHNHPSAVWVRQGISNYLWVYECMWWLNQEYRRRYNHEKNHLTIDKLSALLSVAPAAMIKADNVPFTPPPQCVAEECKVEGDTVAAYRKYYQVSKSDIAKWKLNNIPHWFTYASTDCSEI